MPQMDGFELVRRLRERPEAQWPDRSSCCRRPIARTSSRSIKSLGIARYITKPVTQSILFNGITSALGNGPRRRRAREQLDRRPLRVVRAAAHPAGRRRRGQSQGGGELARAARASRDGGRERPARRRRVSSSRRFDLILLDVQMPVLDGFAATAAIRALEATSGGHIPIIAMTAHAMKGDRERCLSAGMDNYVSKPFRPHELFAEVERVKPSSTATASGRAETARRLEPPASPTTRSASRRRLRRASVLTTTTHSKRRGKRRDAR